MWVSIVEKCWAKACGGYDWTIGGYTKEALRCLTGAPAQEYYHDYIESDKLWKKIKFSDINKYVMCCSMGENFSEG